MGYVYKLISDENYIYYFLNSKFYAAAECWIPGHVQLKTHPETEFNPEIINNGVIANVETIDECQNHCKNNAACYFFTYAQLGMNCYLQDKTALAEFNNRQYIYQDSNIQFFGPKHC